MSATMRSTSRGEVAVESLSGVTRRVPRLRAPLGVERSTRLRRGDRGRHGAGQETVTSRRPPAATAPACVEASCPLRPRRCQAGEVAGATALFEELARRDPHDPAFAWHLGRLGEASAQGAAPELVRDVTHEH